MLFSQGGQRLRKKLREAPMEEVQPFRSIFLTGPGNDPRSETARRSFVSLVRGRTIERYVSFEEASTFYLHVLRFRAKLPAAADCFSPPCKALLQMFLHSMQIGTIRLPAQTQHIRPLHLH